MQTQVLIVGAGPTGLMAANQLMRFGIDFIIIDTKSGPTIESRAIAVTARSLEIYQQLGLSQQAVEQGTKINSFNLYSQGKRKAQVLLGEIGTGMSEFNYLLAFEQSKNEELLYKNLLDNNKIVHWNTEFIEITENTNHVIAKTRNNNEIKNIKAEYLIACDGAKSPVRHQLHFSFEGGTYDNKFFVADTVVDWELEYDKLLISPGDKNFCAFLPLKGEKYYRVLGTLPKEYVNKEDISFSDIEKVVTETIGLKLKFEKVNWFSVYRLHHRCVNTFNNNRVFLAGDSAHVHSPAGGQGMNTGLQDAYNLTWKIAFVLKKYAHPELLNTYTEERLPFAKWLMKFTDRGFNIMTSDNWFVRQFRKYIALNIAGKILGINSIRPRIFKTISQIWYSYNGKSLSRSSTKQKLTFTVGERLTYIDEAHSANKFYELFKEPSFHLLYIGKDELNSEIYDRIKKTFPFPIKIIKHGLTETWKKTGVNSQLFILVRPDNYMAYIADDYNEMEIKNYLKPYFIN